MLSQMGKPRKSLSEASGFLHYPYYLWFSHLLRVSYSSHADECADTRVQ